MLYAPALSGWSRTVSQPDWLTAAIPKPVESVTTLGAVTIFARHYLDETGAISFRTSIATLAHPDSAAILRFLQRRFTTISTLESTGYIVQWQARID